MRGILGSLIALLVLGGCSTVVQRAGDLLDWNVPGEKTLEIYRSGEEDKRVRTEVRRVLIEGEGEALVIGNGGLPGFRLRATLPREGGAIEFTSLEFLSSHQFGWNEFSLELLGGASLAAWGNKAFLMIGEAPERVQIRAGRISLKESRLSGDAALSSLRNRRERILALTEWMRGLEGIPAFAGQEDFEKYWKPRLFPELASRKERPPEWSAGDGDFVRADSIKWNRNYTRQIFPEGLWEYRDSAALLRDWEEGAPWIYLEYAWDSIIASLNEIELEKR